MSAEREWDNLPCFSVPGAAGEKEEKGYDTLPAARADGSAHWNRRR